MIQRTQFLFLTFTPDDIYSYAAAFRVPIDEGAGPQSSEVHREGPRYSTAMRHVSLSILCLLGLSVSAIAADQPSSPAVNADRIQQHIAELSKFGTNPEGGVSRVAFSDADIAGRDYIKKLMQ
ncbi:MAG TPA: hypothetical protein VFQ26_06665, partial [Nitrospiraceae bacterium]|nr:hypothetical protein [Nitrospiraceae bacterium]